MTMAPAASDPNLKRHFYSDTRSAPHSRAATVGPGCGHHRRGTENCSSQGHPNLAAPSAQHACHWSGASTQAAPHTPPWCEFPGTGTQALPHGTERGERILDVSPRPPNSLRCGLTTPAPPQPEALCDLPRTYYGQWPTGNTHPEAHDGHHRGPEGSQLVTDTCITTAQPHQGPSVAGQLSLNRAGDRHEWWVDVHHH